MMYTARVDSTRLESSLDETRFPIAGIGASAGGLEAFSQFLKALPSSTGIGYIFVSHLDPTHKSLLTEILAASTEMPIHEVKEGMVVKTNNLYIIPPNKQLTITHGVLNLSPRSEAEGQYLPIDYFFQSLAKDQEENAIGIVLSGAASDGSQGVTAIKEAGGITFAQSEQSAKFSSMPYFAGKTGYIDFILSPEDIAHELIDISTRIKEYSVKNPKNRQGLIRDKDDVHDIFLLFRTRKNIDFSYYKFSTIKRRIERRMLLSRVDDLDKYVEVLKENPNELSLLCEDILIGVTSFFRDAEKFEGLKKTVLSSVIKNRKAQQPIRIWVAGCSTGEEAYSIAICLVELLGKDLQDTPIQIFATDVNEKAIETARTGIYSPSILSSVSRERLEHFFVKEGGHYQVIKKIRDMCIFAVHNLAKDPPFSKLHIISCCNVLIYMDQALQQRILSMFHYALNSEGHLMLGNSETVGTSDLFSVVDQTHKMYVKKVMATPAYPSYFPTGLPRAEERVNKKTVEYVVAEPNMEKEINNILVSKYAPASIVVSDNMEILEVRGPIGRYLEHPSGQASLNLLKMAPESLLLELRALIHQAQKEKKIAKKKDITVHIDDHMRTITVEVLPLIASPQQYFLILFEEASIDASPESSPKTNRSTKDIEVKRLDQELTDTRRYLQSIIKDQDSANEELKAANEEILSSNEELQSINEELETSKEEIQSTNEEIITVNEELQHRNEQLKEANDYTQAIVETVREPLIILDKTLRIKSANSSFYATFQVNPDETEGRLIYEIGSGQWDIPHLRKHLEQILLRKTQFVNFEVKYKFPKIGKKVMVLNARQMDNLELILLAIEDISEKKMLEQQRQSEKRKDEFISIASHELKTPLTSIKMYSQILQKRLTENKSDTQSVTLFAKMNNQLNGLTKLVNDLLDVSKIRSGKLRLERVEHDLNKIVTEVVDDLQGSTTTHKLIIQGRVGEQFIFDAYRIQQVLANLIINAIKYSSQADSVIISLASDEKDAIVSVQDFGIGVAKGQEKKIFNMYYSIRSSQEERFVGLGLGLRIAMEIVKQHGGKIWVTSTPGEGSTFFFTLPLIKK